MLTFKFRIKDASARKALREYAVACNQVWNFCVSTQKEAERRRIAGSSCFWPSAFTLGDLCAGTSDLLGVNSASVKLVCRQFARSRDAHRKCPRYRASSGAKRALGWVPFTQTAVKVDGDTLIYRKRRLRFWKSRDLAGILKDGAFIEDARGRWYVTLRCEVAETLATGTGVVGIDLGLTTLAVLSDGSAVPALRHYRQHEAALGRAQRSRRKARVRAIHAKIANARRHHLHEASARIARENCLIVVGNVSPANLKKTTLAKAVSDAGWSAFRHMLRYKASRHGAVFIEANERWSSQTCSACGTIPASSPKGMGALGMRRWECSDCGASHDRDVNAAKNILRVGLECQPPAEEILAAE